MSAETDLRDRLIAERENARTAAEALAAVGRYEWFRTQYAAGARTVAELTCPTDPDHLPTPADLATWLSESPDEARAAAAGLLTDLYGRPTQWEPLIYNRILQLAAFIREAEIIPGMLVGHDADGTAFGATMADLAAVHRDWLASDPRPRHALAPLVAAWQRRPSPRPAFVPVNRASLPRFAKLGKDEAHLPDFPEHSALPPPDGQWLLPGFGDAVSGCASWLLWLFDQAGGESLGSGRGAPWALRLFVYALLHLDIADRDGEWHTIRIAASADHAKAIEDASGRRMAHVDAWLHRNGIWHNRRRDWHNLPEALDRMRRLLSYVPVQGIGRVAMLFPSVIPAKPTDPLIEFTARVPRVAAAGDRLNWPRLKDYGADSARLFRAYLAVTAWLGRSAKRGHPITRQIAAPVHGPDGKLRRRKGGAIVRSATELTDNPAARYVGPPLTETDLTRMIGFDPTDRRRRSDARAAFERMEADGVIVIERRGRGWLLFGGPNW